MYLFYKNNEWGLYKMTEKQIKMLCKFAVEHGNRPFTKEEKEIIKQTIKNNLLAEILPYDNTFYILKFILMIKECIVLCC